MKLRKLRALRGQQQSSESRNPVQNSFQNPQSVSADLESIRALFNEKEKELSLAVRKVDDLTHQLEDLRTGRVSNHYPPQIVELERLRRELAYRKQLNEQQNNMISQQRDQLSRGHEEIAKMDNRILELQDRLARKRMMNQQLANQISAATSAKQAQLRAIQQGMAQNRNKNKPVSTVEPFQRQAAVAAAAAQAAAAVASAVAASANSNSNEKYINSDDQNNDPKYQTLPYNTKFNPATSTASTTASGNNVMKKIEALKQEKENNNLEDLPSPPPQLPMMQRQRDHQGNYDLDNNSRLINTTKPISSVAPVFTNSTSSMQNGTHDSPSLPPKPTNSGNERSSGSVSPPPYVPAPPPGGGDSTIVVKSGANSAQNTSNLSVSAHPAEEGTSVDDDMPSASENESEDSKSNSNLMVRPNHNVHISINRRIEMPPAFHFPEDQTPPSDLVGHVTHHQHQMHYAMYGDSTGN